MKLAALLVSAAVWAAPSAPAADMTIVPPPPIRCMVTQLCKYQPEVRDGRRPFHWRLVHGALPPGMDLDPDTGAISGAPESTGEFRPTIAVTDGSQAQQTASRELVITVTALLALEWRKVPALRDTTIAGAVSVTNQTGDEVVLTVVVVAVNQLGKAFTLGYQHFSLRSGNTSPDIPFGMTMPSGTYKVRADAVGEVYDKNRIYRGSSESGKMVVP